MSLSPALPGLPVVPNDFGESSALTSGNSVPQWYGSAEDSRSPKNYIYNRDNQLEEKISLFKEKIAVLEEKRVQNRDQMQHLEENRGQFSIDRRNSLVEEEYEILESMDNLERKIHHLEQERDGLNKIHLDAEGRKYGKRQRFDHIKGNSRYLARNSKGQWISNVGVSGSIKADLRSNAKSQQPVGFRGLGDADVRQAEAAPSVVDAAEPLEYIPYEFADEMDVGEYISSDDFMVLLAETVDGMALRYKPPMYRSPLAMAGAGAILAVVGMKLLKK
jgi:hypothetical protein